MKQLSKSALRHQALALRDSMDEKRRLAASHALRDAVSWSVDGYSVSGYHAIGSELDPDPLLARLRRQGARMSLPVLLDRETMVFRLWDDQSPLVPVGFGTLGPDANQGEVLPDLVLAPLAAFTPTGQRIGYGKGHYDRALAKMQAGNHHPVLVGLAYNEQEVGAFPVEQHDIGLDGVLTPSGLRLFDQGKSRLEMFLNANEPL